MSKSADRSKQIITENRGESLALQRGEDVNSHGGTVEATVTDDGTTMSVSLPRDVGTTQPTSEPKLARSVDQYREAFEQANDAVLITDDEGKILDANPAAADMYSLEKKALLGRSIREFLPDDFDFEAEWHAFRAGEKSRDTLTITDVEGEECIIEYAGTPHIVPGQHLFISRDITEKVEQESELRMKTEAIDAAPIGIVITDPAQEDNPMIYANDTFCELTGYDRDEILGRNCRFMNAEVSQPHGEPVDKIRKAIAAEDPVSTTVRNARKDGSVFWNHVTIAPVKDGTGELKSWIGFQQDVTEQRQREEELKRTAEQLESIVAALPDSIPAVDTDG